MVAPQHQLWKLSEFSAFQVHDPSLRNAVAFAQKTSIRKDEFRISFNQQRQTDESFEWAAVVHEFGHVLTGSNKQTTNSVRTLGHCTAYSDRGRCYRQNSLLNRWVEEFWTSEQLASLRDRGKAQARERRCAADASFISRYAATSPEEDFAESFSAMVLGHKAANPQQQQKLDWLAKQPELREFRDVAHMNNVPQQQVSMLNVAQDKRAECYFSGQ